MSKSICYILILCGVVLTGGVSGWHVYVRYEYVLGLVEMDLYSSFAFCLRLLFMLNSRMFRLFVFFVDLLLCVVCGLLFVVVLSGVLVCSV